MKMYRICALVRRHFLLSFRRLNRLFNVVYWPFINIVIWGFTSVWIQQLIKDPSFAQSILIGLVCWQIVFRVNLEIAKGLFEELIHQNLVNLFSTPLTWLEWVIAMMVMGCINMVFVMTFSSLFVWLLYRINIFILGWYLVPFSLLLLLSGWFIGFFICGLLIYWGLKAQDFVYTIGYLFAPFSAIFYPVQALPYSAQVISHSLPTTPIFEAIRHLLKTGICPPGLLIKSLTLNILYLALALGFFYVQFQRSKVRGLGRLE